MNPGKLTWFLKKGSLKKSKYINKNNFFFFCRFIELQTFFVVLNELNSISSKSSRDTICHAKISAFYLTVCSNKL